MPVWLPGWLSGTSLFGAEWAVLLLPARPSMHRHQLGLRVRPMSRQRYCDVRAAVTLIIAFYSQTANAQLSVNKDNPRKMDIQVPQSGLLKDRTRNLKYVQDLCV